MMPISSDPLSEAIRAFDRGRVLFNETPSELTETIEGQIIAATYGPPMKALEEWSEPAQSLDAAILALGLALRELEHAGPRLAHPMVNAAQRYLEALKKQGGANVVPLFTPQEPDERLDDG